MLQAVLGEIKHNNINNKYNNTGFNYHTDPGYLSYTIDYTLHTSIHRLQSMHFWKYKTCIYYFKSYIKRFRNLEVKMLR